MLRSLKQQQAVFVQQSTVRQTATKANGVPAYKIAKPNEAFSDAEFLKHYACQRLKQKLKLHLCQGEMQFIVFMLFRKFIFCLCHH